MAKEDFLFDVFLSHNRAQKEWTRELARRLSDDGFKPWFDEWELPRHAGRSWIDMLVEGAEQSRKVVLIWSPQFFANDWPEFEASVIQQLDAVSRGERIIPILHTEVEIPKKWGFRQALDFTGCKYGTVEFEFRYQQLVHNLDDKRPFEGDFERFKKKWKAPKADLGEVPPVGPLPPGSRMPHPASGLFVGRENELRELARSLTPGAGTLVGVHAAVTGMGGMGKTQLAIEYAHRYGRRYPGGVFWLNMENADNAVNEVAACGGPEGMNLPGIAELKAPEQAALVRKQWQEDGQASLLIFDDAEDPEVVKKWRPVTGLCSVLITSRRQDWPLEMGVQALPVETLPRAESLKMLEKARPKLASNPKEREAADRLCEQLGDLPLALKVATAYLQKYRTESIASYLQDLLQAPTGDAELRDIWACLAVSYRRLKAQDTMDALALRVFHLAAWFAPASINRRLLAQAAELDDGKSDEYRQFNQAVARLQELSLINEKEDGRLLLHRLLRQFARSQKPHALGSEEAALKVWRILSAFAAKEIGSGLPQELSKERTHLREAAADAERINPKIAADLYNWLGRHGDMLALLQQARADYEHALKIGERVYGPDNPRVATYLNNIGQVLQELGDLAGALEYTKRALKIDERVYGLDHPNVARDANNIGLLLKAQGDLAGALEYARRALRIQEEVYGPNHPTVAIDANNIGSILQEQGDLTEALEYTQRALKIDEQVYGPDHPNVAIRANNIGQILMDQGDLPEALEYTRRALKIDEQVYGPDHPVVATVLNNVGGVLQQLGDLPSAKACFERSLKIDEEMLGARHSRVGRDLDSLGMVLKEMGRFDEARACLERALSIDEVALGADHPNVAARLHNLGRVLKAAGDLARAKLWFQRALDINESIYGSNSLAVVTCVSDLGDVLHDLGDLQGAKACYQRAVRVGTAIYGPDHPDTAAFKKSLRSVIQELSGSDAPSTLRRTDLREGKTSLLEGDAEEAIASDERTELPRVIVLYTLSDADLCKELTERLSKLKQDKVIREFGQRIVGRKGHAKELLPNAELILLLVSQELLDSDYFKTAMFTAAVDAHKARATVFLPIILQPCDWRSSPLSKFPPLPHFGRPLKNSQEPESAWLEIVDTIIYLSRRSHERAVHPRENTMINDSEKLRLKLQHVFVKSGQPTVTFIEPPKFHELLIAIETPGRGIVIEGPSGIGKTTALRKALDGFESVELTARNSDHVAKLRKLPEWHKGIVSIDDFHRLESADRKVILDYLKLLADQEKTDRKLVIVGIPGSGQTFVNVAPDLATRIDVFRMSRVSPEVIAKMIDCGEHALNIDFANKDEIAVAASGSLNIAQYLCFHICEHSGVFQTQTQRRVVKADMTAASKQVEEVLARKFRETVRGFVALGGRRDLTCLKLLKELCHSDDGTLFLDQLKGARNDLEWGIARLLDQHWMESLYKDVPLSREHLLLDSSDRTLVAEDPQLIFYLAGIPLAKLGREVGKITEGRVFISYSHRDGRWLERLEVFLRPLTRGRGINVWSDKKILEGSRWKEVIQSELSQATVAILLLTADFFASDFIAAQELPAILQAAQKEGVRILPVVLRPCTLGALAEFQCANDPKTPLAGLKRVEQEKIWQKVADAVSDAAPEI